MAGSSWTNELISLLVLSAAQKGFSGFFVYSPAPGPGNLIGSWAAAAGTDQFGNHYPAGLSVAVGSLTGTNLFLYNGTPAAGNLLVSVASAAGADSLGNNYLQGIGTYSSAFANSLIAGALEWWSGSLAAGWTFLGQLEITGSSLIANFTDMQTTGTLEVTGLLTALGNLTVGGTTITASGVTAINFDVATIDLKNGNLNLNMADPPNTAAVIAGTATQAQYNACLGGMLNSMKNRQMFA